MNTNTNDKYCVTMYLPQLESKLIQPHVLSLAFQERHLAERYARSLAHRAKNDNANSRLTRLTRRNWEIRAFYKDGTPMYVVQFGVRNLQTGLDLM